MISSPWAFVGVAAVICSVTVVTSAPPVNTGEVQAIPNDAPASFVVPPMPVEIPMPVPSENPPLTTSTTPVTPTPEPTPVSPRRPVEPTIVLSVPPPPPSTTDPPTTTTAPGHLCDVGLVFDPVLGVCVRI